MNDSAHLGAAATKGTASPLEAPVPAVLKIVYQVSPAMRTEFERTLRDMVEAGATSPGRLGVDVIKPALHSQDQREWLVVLRYRTEADLCAWRQSRAAKLTRARLDALTVGAARVERVDGMETWFSLPHRRDIAPPPKWKMTIVSTIAIYPLVLFIQPLLAPLVRGAPAWLALLVTMAVITPLMTWVALPLLIRMLRRWLYPIKPASEDTLNPND